MSSYRGSNNLAISVFFLLALQKLHFKSRTQIKKCFISSHISVVSLLLVNVKFNDPFICINSFLFWLKKTTENKIFFHKLSCVCPYIEMKELIYINRAQDPAKKAVHQSQFSLERIEIYSHAELRHKFAFYKRT